MSSVTVTLVKKCEVRILKGKLNVYILHNNLSRVRLREKYIYITFLKAKQYVLEIIRCVSV